MSKYYAEYMQRVLVFERAGVFWRETVVGKKGYGIEYRQEMGSNRRKEKQERVGGKE